MEDAICPKRDSFLRRDFSFLFVEEGQPSQAKSLTRKTATDETIVRCFMTRKKPASP